MIEEQANQKGATLLELIVGLAITAMILSGVVALIFHEYNGTAATKSSITASREIGNAARWFSRDGMMARNTDLIEAAQPADNLTLSWIERQDFANIPHFSSYNLEGTELRRNYDGTVTTVARYISKVSFSQTDRLITMTISSTPPWWKSKTVEKTYRVYLRPAEEG